MIEIKYGVVANNSAFSVNNLKTFLGNVFLIQTFFDVNTYNTPSWSISAEYYTFLCSNFILLKQKQFNNFNFFIIHVSFD